jgi:hypothetical protein
MHRVLLAVALQLVVVAPVARAQDTGAAEEEKSLAEIDRQLNNPLTSLWSLTFQDNLGIKEGDAIEGSGYTNVLFFQPALPVPVGEKLVFIGRPVFPLATGPDIDLGAREVDGHVTGFGDLQVLSLFGPSRVSGWVWGAGATFKFPTASEPELGSGKYQVGPAAMAINMGKPWIWGFLVQHWEAVAGNDERPETSQTDLQYIVRYSLPNAWSVGAGPSITIDWEADSDDRLTFPIGLGVTKTVRMGNLPVKLRAEVHYSIIRPEDFGEVWNFRFQVTPVIKSPFTQ